MNQFNGLAEAVQLGGWMVYPLSVVAIIGGAIVLERAYIWWTCTRLPARRPIAATPAGFGSQPPGAMPALNELRGLAPNHVLRRLAIPFSFNPRFDPSTAAAPATVQLEMQIQAQALQIQRDMSRGLWLLETIVTAAPLMGLLGTIVGMMQSFRLFGTQGLLNPGSVTGGVAQALVATALGLVIALVALFAFNFFSRASENLTDTLEMCANQWLGEPIAPCLHEPQPPR